MVTDQASIHLHSDLVLLLHLFLHFYFLCSSIKNDTSIVPGGYSSGSSGKNTKVPLQPENTVPGSSTSCFSEERSYTRLKLDCNQCARLIRALVQGKNVMRAELGSRRQSASKTTCTDSSTVSSPGSITVRAAVAMASILNTGAGPRGV